MWKYIALFMAVCMATMFYVQDSKIDKIIKHAQSMEYWAFRQTYTAERNRKIHDKAIDNIQDYLLQFNKFLPDLDKRLSKLEKTNLFSEIKFPIFPCLSTGTSSVQIQ